MRVSEDRGGGRLGFTWVELLIVVVVLGGVVASGIYFIGLRERARLQAVANAEPRSAFRVVCEADKEVYEADEIVSLTAKLSNTTNHRLNFNIWDEGDCWVRLADISGETQAVVSAKIVKLDDWLLTPDDAEEDPVGGGVGFLILTECSVLPNEEVTLTLQLVSPHAPPGTWTAVIWLDNCMRYREALPSDELSSHSLESPPFALNVEASSDDSL